VSKIVPPKYHRALAVAMHSVNINKKIHESGISVKVNPCRLYPTFRIRAVDEKTTSSIFYRVYVFGIGVFNPTCALSHLSLSFAGDPNLSVGTEEDCHRRTPGGFSDCRYRCGV